MLPSSETKMEGEFKEFKLGDVPLGKKERNFPTLQLNNPENLNTNVQPVLVIQSPKTPTLSRKLKAVSLDSDPPKQTDTLEVCRDVFSMPNTPKKQIKQKLSCEFDDTTQRFTLTPSISSNLKRFGSNTSISGSQTLKTLPEIMTLQDFSDNKTEPVRIKAKGLLERRGSNASLTIDLGSNPSISEPRPLLVTRLNTAKSVSNLNLTSFGSDKCSCTVKKCEPQNAASSTEKKFLTDRRKSQTHIETCDNCTIYEFVPSKNNVCKSKCQHVYRRCNCMCNVKCRRKSLSNENLYVPPCNFCQNGGSKECLLGSKNCKGYRRACYPRQADLEASQLLSEDFKLHLQNVQYLQTAGSVLSITDLQQACEPQRVPKLHQEFWEVPLNLQEKCLVSGSQSRNRYRGVLPNEHSRVHLSASQPYIHANYIKGPDYTETTYIATQGPMAHTGEDFWEMVWSNKCNCIVMLTGLVEKGRSKCELYFPLGRKNAKPDEKSYYYVKTTRIQDRFTFDPKNTMQFEEETISFEEVNEVYYGDYKIVYVKEDNLGECAIRELEIHKNSESASRKIRHYWFPNWQDHKMANPDQVLKIALNVLKFIEENPIQNKQDNNIAASSTENKTPKKGELRSNLSLDNNVDKPAVNVTRGRRRSLEMRRQMQVDMGKITINTIRQNIQKFEAVLQQRTTFAQLIAQNSKFSEGPRSSSGKKFLESRRKSFDGPNKSTNTVPLIVHCSAGIGRTGCFLAILNGIKQLRTNFNVDVLAILCSLRLNRGGMVQTAEQYELIHRVLSLYTELM